MENHQIQVIPASTITLRTDDGQIVEVRGEVIREEAIAPITQRNLTIPETNPHRYTAVHIVLVGGAVGATLLVIAALLILALRPAAPRPIIVPDKSSCIAFC